MVWGPAEDQRIIGTIKDSRGLRLSKSLCVAFSVMMGGIAWSAFNMPAPPTVRTSFIDSLGSEPAGCAHGQVGVKTQPAADDLQHLWITTCAGMVHALMSAPANAEPSTPVVVILPQTSRYGADEAMGVQGDPQLSLARIYEKAGYIVVSPDTFLSGVFYNPKTDWDTASFYKQYPRWSASGKMLRDHVSVLDALPQLGLQPSCVVAIGHSLGGYNAILWGALDERVSIVVSSAGFELMRTDPDARDWARSSWFVYTPKLRPWVERPAPREVPWDFDDLLKMIAPRPIFLSQGDADAGFDDPSSVLAAAKDVTPRYGANMESFHLDYFHGPHSFPMRQQTDAIKFVENYCPPPK